MSVFENYSDLYFLLVLPALAYLLYLHYKEKMTYKKSWSSQVLLDKMVVGFDLKKDKIRYLLYLVILFLLILSLANPMWGTHEENADAKGSSVYIALDISSSMDAKDISPSRLERSKKYINDLLKNLGGCQVGLIYFAGQAYLQSPMTADISSISMMTSAVSTSYAGTQGTDIGGVGAIIQNTVEHGLNQPDYLLLITDGEDHESRSVQSIKELAAKGTTTYCVAVGTKDGATIPTDYGMKLDASSGKPVITKLNVEFINELAKSGNGAAYAVDDMNGFKEISDILNQAVSSKKSKPKKIMEYTKYYQYVLGLGILFLLIEYFFLDVIISKFKTKIKS